jgi:hypothetical protein
MLAIPTSAPLPRRAHRRDEWLKRVDDSDDVGVEDRAEGREVLRMLGQRALRDSGVGNDDLGHAEPRDEIGGGPARAHPDPARRRRRPQPDRRQERRASVSSSARRRANTPTIAPCAGVLPRERQAQAAAGAGDEDASRRRLQVFGRSARAFTTSASISGGIALWDATRLLTNLPSTTISGTDCTW